MEQAASQLETNLTRVFCLGAALTGLFAGEMLFAPHAGLRNHFGIEHPTAREEELAKVRQVLSLLTIQA